MSTPHNNLKQILPLKMVDKLIFFCKRN